MRKTFLFSIIGSVVFALASCQKESDNIGPDNSISNGSVTTTALSATVTAVFSDLDNNDKNKGSFGVLYAKASVEDAEDMFEVWKSGDKSVLGKIGSVKARSIKSDGTMTVTVEDLEPETEYIYCAYFESQDKERRKIGKVGEFTTTKFKVTLRNDGAIEPNFYSTKLAATVTDIPEADCKGISFGIILSSKPDPTIADGKTLGLESGVTCKQYIYKFNKLEVGTTYYCRPYVKVKSDNEYIYGETRAFSTRPADDMAVDMGLSVLWAKYLLGSEDDGVAGDYYRWGETSPISPTTYVQPDLDEISGNPDYDAATKRLGGKWRMPTAAEMKELIDNCQVLVEEGPDSQEEGLTNKLKLKAYNTGKVLTLPQTGYFYASSWFANGQITVSYSRPYGYFYLYAGSQTVTTFEDTYYRITDEAAFLEYEATHEDLYLDDLLALGLIEEVTELVTQKGATYMQPGFYLDEYDYWKNYEEIRQEYSYTPRMSNVAGRYAFNILPVRDRD